MHFYVVSCITAYATINALWRPTDNEWLKPTRAILAQRQNKFMFRALRCTPICHRQVRKFEWLNQFPLMFTWHLRILKEFFWDVKKYPVDLMHLYNSIYCRLLVSTYLARLDNIKFTARLSTIMNSAVRQNGDKKVWNNVWYWP